MCSSKALLSFDPDSLRKEAKEEAGVAMAAVNKPTFYQFVHVVIVPEIPLSSPSVPQRCPIA